MRKLVIIPARSGSKGLPGKNIKLLGEKPLIVHTINFALDIRVQNDIICVTTDDEKIFNILQEYPSIRSVERPESLATDSAGMNEVLLHAIEHFEKLGEFFDLILLLQPTSPLRQKIDYENLARELDEESEIVVSVKESKSNPYFNLFEDDDDGFLKKSKDGAFFRRQDCPRVYEYNGSMYLSKVASLKKHGLHGMKKIKKSIMPDERSVDIDDLKDWLIASHYYASQKIKT